MIVGRLVSSLLDGTRAMLASNLLAFENKKYTAYDRFHGNGPYGEIPTKKEPIRTLGFALPCNNNFNWFPMFDLHFQLNFKGRVINYKAEGRIHKLQWVYDGTAWDVESGTSVKARHYKSTQGAIEHAVKELIDNLKAQGILS